jgi:hypothetical protein
MVELVTVVEVCAGEGSPCEDNMAGIPLKINQQFVPPIELL